MLLKDILLSFYSVVPIIFIELFKTMQLKLLNRIATVKNDGSIEFEVPGDIEPRALDIRSEDVYKGAVNDDSPDSTDLLCIPPLQIVMLIVGTRGDVQPFIAIGKRLQVR